VKADPEEAKVYEAELTSIIAVTPVQGEQRTDRLRRVT